MGEPWPARLAKADLSSHPRAAGRAGAAAGGVSSLTKLFNYAHISFGHQLLARRFHLDQLSEMRAAWGRFLVAKSPQKEKEVNLGRNESESTSVLEGSSQECSTGNVTKLKGENGLSSM